MPRRLAACVPSAVIVLCPAPCHADAPPAGDWSGLLGPIVAAFVVANAVPDYSLAELDGDTHSGAQWDLPLETCGQCSATNAVLCVDPEPLCNLSNGECVPCFVAPDGSSIGCVGDASGAVCIEGADGSAQCGCETDADCGSELSGRVCDPSMSVCVDGCRGEGGNGCPEGLECTSTDSSIGSCVAPSPGNTPSDTDDGPSLADTGDVSQDGGCACTTPSAGSSGSAAGWLALVAAAVFARRRRS